MSITNFPNGASSFGAPIVPGPAYVVPSVPYSNIAPNTAGNGSAGVYFVCGDTGNDSYPGTSPQLPFKTLDMAYNQLLGGRNEIVYILGGDAAVSYSAAIVSGGAGLNWAKNYTHLIGLTAPLQLGQRARITNGASTVLLTPLITISGHGCIFQNIEFANVGSSATAASVCMAVTGVRNAFLNCQISGGLGALTTGATVRSLLIGGTVGGTFTSAADENYFSHCYIGLDTNARVSTSAEIEIGGGSARVVFEDCKISTYTTAGTNFYVKIGTSGIDRFVLFNRCQFLNADVLSAGTILADAMSLSATPGGRILITGSLITGATSLATGTSDTAVYGDNAYAAATTAKGVLLSW